MILRIAREDGSLFYLKGSSRKIRKLLNVTGQTVEYEKLKAEIDEFNEELVNGLTEAYGRLQKVEQRRA